MRHTSWIQRAQHPSPYSKSVTLYTLLFLERDAVRDDSINERLDLRRNEQRARVLRESM
jgi:hypothetical protein